MTNPAPTLASAPREAVPAPEPSRSGLMARLKLQTREAHLALEATSGLMQDALTCASYAQYLARTYGLLAPLEERLETHPEFAAWGLDLRARRKREALQQDLVALGLAVDGLPRADTRALAEAFPHALGCAYVLEGATLGGQVLTRRLRLQLGAALPCAYLNGYGESTGTRWREFGHAVERWSGQAPADEHAQVVQGATDTFRALGAWLAQEAP